MWKALKEKKCWVARKRSDRDRKVYIRLFQSYFKFCEDQDWRYLDRYAERARIGWRGKMDRAPAVFERKTRRALGPEKLDPAQYQATSFPNH